MKIWRMRIACWISKAIDMHSEYVFFAMAQHPPVDQGLLIVEASRSHSGTPHSVGLLWTSDQPDAQTSTSQHTTLTTNIHGPRRDSNPQSQQASDRRPTPQTARPVRSARICNNNCFSKVRVVTRTRLAVTFTRVLPVLIVKTAYNATCLQFSRFPSYLNTEHKLHITKFTP